MLCLEMGADDYLPKPFGTRELLARVRAVLRRAAMPAPGSPAGARRAFEFAGWRLTCPEESCDRRRTHWSISVPRNSTCSSRWSNVRNEC